MKKMVALVLSLCLLVLLPVYAMAEEATASIANPWLESTEEQAAEYFGMKFAITAPEGFEKTEFACLDKESMDPEEYEAGERYLRAVYMKGEEMFRIHMDRMPTESLEAIAQDPESDFVAISKGDAQGFFSPSEHAVYMVVPSALEQDEFPVRICVDSAIISEASAADFLGCVTFSK